jgi:acetylornithine deacetylase/succinyl-diaminopimelate desuccinylase-like protein
MRNVKRAALQAGQMRRGERLRGWDVSCDARLFARAVPRLSVITCGAGKLEFAHSDQERVSIPELFRVVEFLTEVLIRETGSEFA